jgi:opacity protein-like surface antigen
MLALSGQAIAADLYVPEQPAETPAVEPVAAASGWYLRGDLSYDFVNMKGAKYFQGSNGLVNDFDSADVDNTGNIGLGVGYQINDNLRVDTTFDYMFSADFRGSTSGRSTNTGSVCDFGCKSRDVSAMSAYSLMANAYVDITKIGIVTPYLGAGIGGTYVKWDDLKNTACADNNPNNCDPTVTHKGRENWRFTYAVMAGASVDINCQLKGDVGYRYRHVASGEMFGYRLNGGPGKDKGFDIHEARAGLRYSFGGCEQQAYLPPVDMPMQQQPVFK